MDSFSLTLPLDFLIYEEGGERRPSFYSKFGCETRTMTFRKQTVPNAFMKGRYPVYHLCGKWYDFVCTMHLHHTARILCLSCEARTFAGTCGLRKPRQIRQMWISESFWIRCRLFNRRSVSPEKTAINQRRIYEHIREVSRRNLCGSNIIVLHKIEAIVNITL